MPKACAAQLLSPAKRRQAVEHIRDTLGRDVVTERRACRVLGQARNTQRRKAHVADDEPLLVKRIVWMASEYGRYGYRRITALLRAEGWSTADTPEPRLELRLRDGPDRRSKSRQGESVGEFDHQYGARHEDKVLTLSRPP